MLKTVLLVMLALFVAIGGGAASVWAMLENAPPIGALEAGPWQAFPRAGTPEADPYSRARFARRGGVALGRAEGIVFTASSDSAGRPLTRSCTYHISGATPSARLWTLHAVDESGQLLAPLGRRLPALHSQMVLYQSGDTLSITVSPHPAAENWLAVTGEGSMHLVLTLLDTPVSTDWQVPDLTLPQISRAACDA